MFDRFKTTLVSVTTVLTMEVIPTITEKIPNVITFVIQTVIGILTIIYLSKQIKRPKK